MIKRTLAMVAAAILLMANQEAHMAHAQTQAPSNPQNGPSVINETYNDWVVLCSAGEKGRQCVVTQQQRKKDTNQLVLAVEFNQIDGDGIKGSMILPFGLRLADGVTIQIGEGAVSSPAPFVTCMPAGCVVPLGFDAATLRALRGGSVVKLVAKAHEGGQNVLLNISLKGFAVALDRALELAKS